MGAAVHFLNTRAEQSISFYINNAYSQKKLSRIAVMLRHTRESSGLARHAPRAGEEEERAPAFLQQKCARSEGMRR